MLSQDSSEGEHGHIHCDEDQSDEYPDAEDECGFEHRTQAPYGVFELVGEGFALPAEHLGQTVGLLSDADERDQLPVVERGEPREGVGESVALFEPSRDLVERLAVGVESDDLAEHPNAGEQGHARGA